MLRNRTNCWRYGQISLSPKCRRLRRTKLSPSAARYRWALSVVGAKLRGADAEFWSDTLDLLRKAGISAIEEQLPEGQ
jgi:hypothetical protein